MRTRPERSARDASIDDDTEQVHIVMGGRALRRGDDDREALDVVNHVFGGGLSSRLFEEIRERRGLGLLGVLGRRPAYADSRRCSSCTPAPSPTTPTRSSG